MRRDGGCAAVEWAVKPVRGRVSCAVVCTLCFDPGIGRRLFGDGSWSFRRGCFEVAALLLTGYQIALFVKAVKGENKESKAWSGLPYTLLQVLTSRSMTCLETSALRLLPALPGADHSLPSHPLLFAKPAASPPNCPRPKHIFSAACTSDNFPATNCYNFHWGPVVAALASRETDMLRWHPSTLACFYLKGSASMQQKVRDAPCLF